jgi:KDO2-lipid IV(A) lauroyltransferase
VLSSLKQKITFLFFLLGRKLFRIFSDSTACKMGRGLGYLSSFCFPREKAISEAQLLATKVASTAEQATKIYRDLCCHIGESIVEVLISDRILDGVGSFKETQLALTDRVKEGQGGVVLSAHMGNFELLAAHFLSKGASFRPVGRMPNFAVLRDIAEFARGQNNVETLWREDSGAATHVIKMLRSKEIVAALIDQDTKLNSLYSSFFNIPARTPIALMQVCFRYRLPFYSCFIVKVAPFRYEIIAEEIPYDPDDAEATDKILTVYHQRLENVIRQYPEQWIWWHRRWRHRPESDSDPKKLLNTEQYLKWLNNITIDSSNIAHQK